MQNVECIEIDDALGTAFFDLRPADFASRTQENPATPRAWILRETDWEIIAAHCPTVEDRGRKHKAKGLHSYLNSRQQTPVIRASYESGGRCLQSIETLLRHAANSEDWRLFIVAVDATTFDGLRDLAGKEQNRNGNLRAIAVGKHTDPNIMILHHLGRVSANHPSRKKLIGISEKTELVRILADRAARCDLPVLILGDSGTGKEVTARLIHTCGARSRTGRFLAVNCAAIPDDLLESELFGSVKGAYTGATDKRGLWEMAEDGTLFLDEIGDLSLRHQAKVLRALEAGVVRRVGGDEDVSVNARIIAATHRDIESRVQVESFRQDLYYRLYGIRILLPSLDECPQDIPHLANHFWREIVGHSGAKLPHSVCDLLESLAWPGNGRQLKSLLKRLRHLFDVDIPTVEQLQLLTLHERAAYRTHGADCLPSEGAPQMQNLTHLRRTAAALHAVELLLKTVKIKAGCNDSPVKMSDLKRADLRAATHEIRALTRQPILFGEEKLFRAVEQIAEQLTEIDEQMDVADGENLKQATVQTFDAIQVALTLIFQGAGQITHEMGK